MISLTLLCKKLELQDRQCKASNDASLQEEIFKIDGGSVRECKRVALLEVEEEKERRCSWRVGVASCGGRGCLYIWLLVAGTLSE